MDNMSNDYEEIDDTHLEEFDMETMKLKRLTAQFKSKKNFDNDGICADLTHVLQQEKPKTADGKSSTISQRRAFKIKKQSGGQEKSKLTLNMAT